MPRDDRPATAPGPATPAARAVTIVAAVVLLVLVGGLAFLSDREPAPPAGAPPLTPPPGTSAIPAPPPATTAPAVPPPSMPASLCPPAVVSPPITALSFNIHGGLGGGGLNLDRIAEEITTWDPDVVLLQEVDHGRPRTSGQDQATVLGERTGRHAVYGGNQPKPGGGTIGNAILSRHPIVSSANTALPMADGKEQRGALHAVVDVDGMEISVYSTHWDHHTGAARRAQATAVAALVAADPRPVIVGGDLNAEPRAPAYRTLRRAGLRDAWRVGEGDGLTVPARNPRRRIDFLMYGGGFVPRQATVLTSAISDHRAVWSRLEVHEEMPCIPVGEPTG